MRPNNYNLNQLNLFLLITGPIIFSLITAFKVFGLDPDYFNYFHSFGLKKNFYNSEPIPYVIEQTIISIGGDFSLYLFFITLCSLTIKFYFFRNSTKYSIIAISIYLITFFPLHEYTQIRASLSTAFTMLFLLKLQNKHKKKATLYLALSILCHYSAIVNIAILFVKKIGFKSFFVSLSIITIILSNISIDYFENAISYSQLLLELYINKHGPKESFNLINFSIISVLAPLIILVFLNLKINNNDIYIKSIAIGVSLYFIFGSIGLMTMAFRYLEFFSPLLIVVIINYFSVSKNKFIWLLALTLFTLINSQNILISF